ncbi:SprT-like domain-containing protein [Pengzhenrongella sp.]|jgi:predicted SprT family Zn-dependent metalloprotease|uniref:SprT-like domain-containing protein n=1 Tax=Pengzhenrongella sp. TaxID=2888820 RepID=UPI002F9486CC
MDIHEARVLAEGLMREHQLTGWRLTFDNARTRAGICRYGTREIGLSRVLTELHPADLVRCTILHEIAHALVGPRHAHDAVWRAKDRSLGGTGERKVSASAPRPTAPWVGTCARGHEVTRHRRPARPSSCLQCAPGFSREHLFVWRLHGRLVPSSAAYEAELAAIRAAREESLPALVPERLPVGARVVLGGTGKYAGLSGRVEKRGRTRYHVRTPVGTVLAPFGLVRAA